MAPKSILLLGATGPAGIEFLRQAVEVPELTILVYARNASTRLPTEIKDHPQVTILPGDSIENADTLRAAVAHRPDAIVSLLGPPSSNIWGWVNPFSPDGAKPIFAQCYEKLVDAMKEYGVRRILVMGTISIIDEKDKPSWARDAMVWVVWAAANKAWRNIIAIKDYFWSIPADAPIDWTVFRIGMVTDGPFQSVVDGSVADGKTTTSIRRTELATWLLRNALAERAELVRQMPMVSTSAKAPGSTE
ncbi:hypothetical protein DFH27DRAFT_574346 [Peziza echinospora]|nr:hypothetical protein DFH27DRAFT_574346 [Peziza echinospora]